MFCIDHCQECWPGTGGIDCMEHCPANFYGRLCAEICDCKTCDRVYGCQNGTGMYLNNTPEKYKLNLVCLQFEATKYSIWTLFF